MAKSVADPVAISHIAPENTAPLRVAVLGAGVVGTEVVRLFVEHSDDLAARVGADLEIVGIGVRDASTQRDSIIDPQLLTEHSSELVSQADVVVELMGGIEPARTLILSALAGGASVVTANKALLAEYGPELYEAAAAAGTDLYFEAAVAGAIPLIRPLRESLAGDRVDRVLGIVNGTTNYVLDQMDTTGLGFAEAVAQAQELGYAEADPTADVEGFDAAAKAAILASLAFHTRVPLEAVAREGISNISADDVAAAKESGHVIKLLAILERSDAGLLARVHPALVPRDHPLAGVRGAFNAVFVEAKAAGELMFYGRGAGGAPTASAVMGDIVTAARNKLRGTSDPAESTYAGLPVVSATQAQTRYQIRLLVADRPGVLAQVATAIAEHGVSLEAVRQGPPIAEGQATLIITTHVAREADLAATVTEISALESVNQIESVLRVEGA